MTHHRYNRGDFDTTEFVPRETRWFGLWWVAYYARILCLLYVGETLSPLLFFFWKRLKRSVASRPKNKALLAILNLFTQRMVSTIQFDAVLTVAFFAAQIYANRFDLRPFLILFFWRAFIISFQDNAYHYGTDPHDVQAAANLAVPGCVQPLILNHNLHRLHHRYPSASWSLLKELAAKDGEGYDANLATTIWLQLKGPMRRPIKEA